MLLFIALYDYIYMHLVTTYVKLCAASFSPTKYLSMLLHAYTSVHRIMNIIMSKIRSLIAFPPADPHPLYPMDDPVNDEHVAQPNAQDEIIYRDDAPMLQPAHVPWRYRLLFWPFENNFLEVSFIICFAVGFTSIFILCIFDCDLLDQKKDLMLRCQQLEKQIEDKNKKITKLQQKLELAEGECKKTVFILIDELSKCKAIIIPQTGTGLLDFARWTILASIKGIIHFTKIFGEIALDWAGY